jgi:hypothetical protein
MTRENGMKERPVFFTISGKLATHTSVLQNQSASADQSSLLGAAFATAFFGGAAASSLGAAAFGAAAGFLRTGATTSGRIRCCI